MGVRITVIIVIFSLLYSSLVFKLYTVQVEGRERYEAEAFSFHVKNGFLNPLRGGVYFTDKSGAALPAAINKEYPTVYARPKDLKDALYTAEVLSGISMRDKDELTSILSKKDDPYEPIIKKATDEEVVKVLESNFECLDDKDGCVDIEYKRSRLYPLGTVAAHLLGFVSADESVGGAYGIELYYEDDLKGIAGVSA